MLPIPLRNILCFGLALAAPFQTQKPQDQVERPPVGDSDGTLRVFVNLVQVDAVVTDKDGFTEMGRKSTQGSLCPTLRQPNLT
jgi:hypothetical protein